MQMRFTLKPALLLAVCLTPSLALAAPKVRPLDQPKLDLDGKNLPLSIQPPKPAPEAKLTKRERRAAEAEARKAEKQSAAETSAPGKQVEAEAQVEAPAKVASLDPAVTAPKETEIAAGTEPKPAAKGAEAPQSGIRALIAHHAAANGVPFHLADAMVKIESRYNPRARKGVNLGLGQINFRTARSLGYGGSAAGLLDANTNLTYSVKYLAQAYRLAHGDTCGTVTRYQNGFGATRMSGANRAYCAKVKAHQG